MANYRALVFTPYAGAGIKADPYRPLLQDVFGYGFTDVTSEKIIINLYLVEVAVSTAQLNAIKADSRFKVLSTIDEATGELNKEPNGQVKQYLTDAGFTAPEAATLVNGGKGTLDEMADEVRKEMKVKKDKNGVGKTQVEK